MSGVEHTGSAVAAYRGGSDYHWYKVGGPGQELLFITHRVILGYLDNQSEIDGQLAQMYANGQRRLRIGIEFADDQTPSRLHLTDGRFGAKDVAQLTALLTAIKTAGFEAVHVNINGSGVYNVRHWEAWDEAAYQVSLGVVRQTRELVSASGLPYLLDLGGEYTPVLRGQELRVQYCQRLWAEYVAAFGAADSVGFSIIANISNDRFGHLRDIYGDTPPRAFDLHMYSRRDESTGRDIETSYQRFLHAHQRMMEVGYGDVPWMSGESFYNDAVEADQLVRAIGDTGRTLLFLLQFPHIRPPFPTPPHYSDVGTVPLEFNEYIRRGF